MELKLGCGHLADDEFIAAFEECRLPHGVFHHADHIRLAWLYVRKFGAAQAEQRLLAGIRKMALHAGAPQKFLHTTTVAWARLVAAAPKHRVANESFEQWIAKHPQLLNKDALAEFYSTGVLESPEARSGWVDPDRNPLRFA